MRPVAAVTSIVAAAVVATGISLVGDPGASARSGPTRPAQTAHRPAAPGTTITLSVPPVVFQAEIAVRAGRLRTALVLADPSVTGAAQVVGRAAGVGCTADLVQGQSAWLDCDLDGVTDDPTVIEVVLSDSRRIVRIVAPRNQRRPLDVPVVRSRESGNRDKPAGTANSR
jgi:hypothetical protein